MSQLFETLEKPTTAEGVRYARVALEQGIDTSSAGLTYAIPPSLATLNVGDRVIVPLGRKDHRVPGYVVEIAERSDVRSAKEIVARDPKGLSLPPDLIELAKWIAGYYCCPLGMVFTT